MGILLFVSGMIDYKYQKIPNLIVFLIFGWSLFFSSASVYERIAGFFVTAIPFFIIALCTDIIKGVDFKFLVVCATAMGINVFVRILGISTIIAIVWSLIKVKKSVPLAFVLFAGYVINLIL